MSLEDKLPAEARYIDLKPHHRDNLPGRGYIDEFDPNKLERPGYTVLNTVYDPDHGDTHFDVIEKNSKGEVFHNRIYKP